MRGSATYKVQLWMNDGELEFACSCPVGPDGMFCKHAVAVALIAADPDRAGGERRGEGCRHGDREATSTTPTATCAA